MQLRTSGEDAVTITQTEVDFGSTPLYSQTFTIADSRITSTSKFIAQLAYDAPTGKSLDELDLDNISIQIGLGTAALGSMQIVVTGLTGYLSGKFKINYLITN